MHINGGDIYCSLASYDAIRKSDSYINIIGYGEISSGSSLLFQSADHRIMMPHSTFMFHNLELELGGDIPSMESDLRECKNFNGKMLDIYAQKCVGSEKFKKLSISNIRNRLKTIIGRKKSVYLSPKEAVEWGLTDEISN